MKIYENCSLLSNEKYQHDSAQPEITVTLLPKNNGIQIQYNGIDPYYQKYIPKILYVKQLQNKICKLDFKSDIQYLQAKRYMAKRDSLILMIPSDVWEWYRLIGLKVLLKNPEINKMIINISCNTDK